MVKVNKSSFLYLLGFLIPFLLVVDFFDYWYRMGKPPNIIHYYLHDDNCQCQIKKRRKEIKDKK